MRSALPVLPIGDGRRIALDVVQRHIRCFIDDVQASFVTAVHQVARQLGLAIDDDMAAGQRGDVDADETLAIGQIEAVMHQPFGLEARIEPQAGHHVHGPCFQHAGADAAEHIVARHALQHDAFDSLRPQPMAQQKPGRPCADDANLRPHDRHLPQKGVRAAPIRAGASG